MRVAACLRTLCLLAVCLPAWGGTLGTDFSNKFSRGLQKTLSGQSGGVGSLVPAASGGDLGGRLTDCTSGSTAPECMWLQFVLGCIVMGLIVCPILCFFSCCGFMCGRRCCQCCCKPCGQPNCGGPKPTREYPVYDTWGCLAVALPIFFVMLLSFSAVGFASLQEIPGDIDDVFDGLRSMSTVPDDFSGKIRSDTQDLKGTIRDRLTPLNDAFALIGPVKTAVSTLRTKVVALQDAVKDLAMLIEGCSSGTAQADCSFSTTSPNPNLSKWAQCGATATAGTVAGVAMRLSDGATTNPSCRDATSGADAACKCCNECSLRLTNIDAILSTLPSDSMLNEISVEIPVGQLDAEIDKAVGDFQKPLDDMQDSWPLQSQDLTDAQNSMGDFEGTIAGINCGIWLPQWLALIAILVALALGRKGAPEAQAVWGDRCWWIAYVVGVLWFILLVCPMFGLWSIIAIPLEDICDIIPVVGGTSEDLVSHIESDGNTDFDTKPLQDIMDKCVLKAEGGYIWSVLEIQKSDFSDILSEFDRFAQTSVSDQESSLDVLAYTKVFTDNKASFKGISSSTYTPTSCTFGTCTADTTQYTTDLTAKINAINTATDEVATSIDAAKARSDEFWAALKLSLSGSADTTNEMVESLWAFGECNMISQKYDEFVTPFCVVSDNLGSFWACLMMVGCAWLALFPIIICSSKRWYQLREGFEEDKPFETFSPIGPGQGPTANPPSSVPFASATAIGQPLSANTMAAAGGDAPLSADVVAVMSKSSPPLPPLAEDGEEAPKAPPKVPQYPTGAVPPRMSRPANVTSTSGGDYPFPPPTNPDAAPVPSRRVPSYPVAKGPPATGDTPTYPNLEISKVGIV